MPRKKLIRRFEPRYGVSQPMIDVEAKAVARELEDYLVLSFNELREQSAKLATFFSQAEQALENGLHAKDEREQLALRCLILRDCCHLLQLYHTQVQGGTSHVAEPASSPVVAAISAGASEVKRVEEKALPFGEWLFEV